GIDKHYKIHKSTSISVDVPLAMTYKVKIKEYDKDYESPTFGGKGCYIATCVYGSYDCPEVWVLRRFRDKVLAKNVFGRVFINVYYAISPKLVKAFGKRPLFRNLCQKPLDIFVRHLHKKGFADTRYKDTDYE
ncbi:MAG: CFI-box-CTERM domain-containing protein, partial [Parabacteroides sp.]|nr:CFI-box-CTERM domain-containing protein [Parabacteroides sp.]